MGSCFLSIMVFTTRYRLNTTKQKQHVCPFKGSFLVRSHPKSMIYGDFSMPNHKDYFSNTFQILFLSIMFSWYKLKDEEEKKKQSDDIRLHGPLIKVS